MRLRRGRISILSASLFAVFLLAAIAYPFTVENRKKEKEAIGETPATSAQDQLRQKNNTLTQYSDGKISGVSSKSAKQQPRFSLARGDSPRHPSQGIGSERTKGEQAVAETGRRIISGGLVEESLSEVNDALRQNERGLKTALSQLFAGGSSSNGLISGTSGSRQQQELPAGQINQEYCTRLASPEGRPPFLFKLQRGALPEGLRLDQRNGMLCGKPTTAGIFVFGVWVRDGFDQVNILLFRLVITEEDAGEESGDLRISTATLASAYVGSDYVFQLQAGGGESPYSWRTTGLPEGLSMDSSSGVIAGVATVEGSYALAVTLSDSSGETLSREFGLEVLTSPLFITTQNLPSGSVGVYYQAKLSAQGGAPPYLWQITSGSIPQGLSFSSQTGTLDGVPEEEFSGRIRFRVADQEENSDNADLPFSIEGSSLSIDTGSLPTATVGEDYYLGLTASGGHPPYRWTLLSGALGRGMEFQAEGVLIGTPEESLQSGLRIQVGDSEGVTVQKELSWLVDGGSLRIQTQTLAQGQICEAYSENLRATGGNPPYIWSLVSGALSEEFSLTSDGLLSGTPGQSFSSAIEVSVADKEGLRDTRSFSLRIQEEALSISNLPDTLPAEAGKAVLYQFLAQGGCADYHWNLLGGSLPEGVSLSETGLLQGTPSDAGEYQLTLGVVDSRGERTQVEVRLSVAGAELRITTESLVDAQAGVAYQANLLAEGGVTPYTWTISSGGIPQGLNLNTGSGGLSGKASESGDFSFVAVVYDASGSSRERQFLLYVAADDLKIATTDSSLPRATVDKDYQTVFSATGGVSPYTWQIIGDDLPPGIILSDQTKGLVQGIPSEDGIFSFLLQVSDAEGTVDTSNLRIEVEPAELDIATVSPLPGGAVGEFYEVVLEAHGGKAPYHWIIIEGVLPNGLDLNQSSGVISGQPESEIEGVQIAVQLSDSTDASISKPFLFSIEASNLPPISALIAQASSAKVGLAWKNPSDPGFVQAVVVRKDSGFPSSPDDGLRVYAGSETNTVDMSAENGTTFYYAAFADYGSLGHSSTHQEAQAIATPQLVSLNGRPDPFVDEVVTIQPLDPGNCFGLSQMPATVLGPPQGAGQWQGSLDTVALHSKVNDDAGRSPPYGGSIVLRFVDNIVVNASGSDFTVFENAFRIPGTDSYWIEPAIVEVSIDGITFHRFPFDFVPHYDDSGELDLHNPFSYREGFVGVRPVFSRGVSPDPTKPSVSGGDFFDLSAIPGVNLSWIQYVRITATGDAWLRDKNGDLVRHSNEAPSWGASGTGNSGTDLDAVAAVNY